MLSHNKYLGAPTFVGRSRIQLFLFLVDRIKKRLSGYMDRLDSWVGRKVLIKVVAQAILIYIISLFKLPTELCHAIQSSIIRFQWGHNQEDRKIRHIKASRLCRRKEDGGLGFCDIIRN